MNSFATLLIVILVIIISCILTEFTGNAAKLKGPLQVPANTITPYQYRRLGYKKLGNGYWKKDWDFFYAKKKQKDPKRWMKLDTNYLKVLGGGYAVEEKGKAFFKGEVFAGNNYMKYIVRGLKVFKGPKGKPSAWAQGETGATFYRGNRVAGIDSQKVVVIGKGWVQVAGKTFYKGIKVHGVAGKIKVNDDGTAVDTRGRKYGKAKMEEKKEEDINNSNKKKEKNVDEKVDSSKDLFGGPGPSLNHLFD